MAKNVKHQGKRPSESQTPNRINKSVIQDSKSEEIIGKKMFIANMYRKEQLRYFYLRLKELN